MSAPAAHSSSHAAGHGEHQGKFHIFVQLAMILAVITGVEILVIYLPLAKWIITTTLIVLSIVKFMLVIFIFMHLKWDKLFCTILFFIGLVLAGGTMWALLAVHGADASKPVGPAYEEV
ncbi:MAG TPA: cytochrome C oxidase subunit IV family protein [Opitutaceae bacterium]